MYAQYHDEQADGDNDEQRKGEPAHDHGAGADAGPDRAVAKVLGNGRRGDGRRVLPEDGDEDEDGGDEDDGEGDLRDGAGGKGLDVALRAGGILLLMPAGECGQKDEADKGEDDGDDAAMGAQLASVSLSIFMKRAGRGW